MAEAKTVTIGELCQMNDQEDLIPQGCGGDLQEWVDDINELLVQAGTLQAGSAWKARIVRSFQYDGLANLLFPLAGASLDMGRPAIWRLQTYKQFGGTWLSDHVSNWLGGFIQKQRFAKLRMALVGQDGNILSILGRVFRSLKQARQSKQADEMPQRATSSGSYNEVLCIISEYVEMEFPTAPKPQKSVQKKGRDIHE